MLHDIEYFYGLNCTINTTEDCNLRCKYCYEINKKPKSIDFDTCKKFIDLVFNDEIIGNNADLCNIGQDDYFIVDNPATVFKSAATTKSNVYRGRIFDFIGGDSLVDPELLDKILEYINTANFKHKNNLLYGWRASLTTNGTLFKRKDVRDFCEKWRDNLSLTVSIDGCPEIHDLNRVYPDGRGSMKDILEYWPWYQKTFPESSLSTKSTCNRDSIYYLYDSLKFMHEVLGIKYIRQNFIMEDTGCTEEDYKELDRQLERCTEYYLEHFDDFYWSMLGDEFMRLFDDNPFEDPLANFYVSGRCGSGIMPTLGIDGNIYPCFRWLDHTQNSEKVMVVGNVNDGFTAADNFKRVSEGAIRCNCTKDEKCRTCEYESVCSYCIGGCYSEFGEFRRTTYICEITKLQVKWAKILYEEIKKKNKKSQGCSEDLLRIDRDPFLTMQAINTNLLNAEMSLNLNLLDLDSLSNSDLYKGIINKLYSLINSSFLKKEVKIDRS